MVEIPTDLALHWFVMPRPQGKRCYVVASGGITTCRSRGGFIWARFPSLLPGGSFESTSGSRSAACILDCIFVENPEDSNTLPTQFGKAMRPQHEKTMEDEDDSNGAEIEADVKDSDSVSDDPQCYQEIIPESNNKDNMQHLLSMNTRLEENKQSQSFEQNDTSMDDERASHETQNHNRPRRSKSKMRWPRSGTFYILDIMCWKDYLLYDSDAEFRQFWLRGKMEETQAELPMHHMSASINHPLATIGPVLCAHQSNRRHHSIAFVPAPVWRADYDGIEKAYTSTLPYCRDGLLFYNTEAHYELGSPFLSTLPPYIRLYSSFCTYFSRFLIK